MNHINIVIGANYGDEGKGRTTAFLAQQNPNAIVVRFNGGAQAAHRCVVNGVPHIFKHFGSGTLTGNRTYLTSDFVINPILFFQELRALNDLGIYPNIAVSPQCMITTPYDMMINQWLEESRGENRHGSCGYGINETVIRTNDFPVSYALTFKRLQYYGRERLSTVMDQIRTNYVYHRTHNLNLKLTPEQKEILMDDNIKNNFIQECVNMNQCVECFDFKTFKSDPPSGWSTNELIFEGAQGLGLDQNFGTFPFVTRSNTGVTNVLKVVGYMPKHTTMDVYYVTRCYTTRHGNGPFFEDRNFPTIIDHCNKPNPWQGTMRFGWLCLPDLIRNIKMQQQLIQESAQEDVLVRSFLNITCVDQLSQFKLHMYDNNDEFMLFDTWQEFVAVIEEHLHRETNGNVQIGYISDSESGDMISWTKQTTTPT